MASQPEIKEQATTRNPPDLSWNTHIFGLNGVTDAEDQASPTEDGWMVSDFFLWKAIFRGMGLSQQYFTCVDPTALVDKYESGFPNGPYIQGSPYEDDRAVVLSRDQLLQATESLTTVSDDGTASLRNTFMDAFVPKCREAAAAGERVFLLVTSHGEEDDEGAFVCGLPLNGQPESNLLTPKMLTDALKDINGLGLSIFATSCYSENWAITPRWSPLVSTVMVAAETDEMSQSWPHSTMNRFGGGPFSTFALQELLRETKAIQANQNLMTGSGIPSSDTPDGRTFREWCDAVEAEMLKQQIRARGFGSKPCFTRHGGHDRFWIRSGYPIQDYLANWNRLPKLPKSLHASLNLDRSRLLEDISLEEMAAWEQKKKMSPWVPNSLAERDTRTGSRSRAQILRHRLKARDLAVLYLASNPGLETVHENRGIHSKANLLIEYNHLADHDVVKLERALSFRLQKMKAAEDLLRAMGNISMPPIATWACEHWSSNLNTPERKENFKANLAKVKKWPLCRQPTGIDCGRPYDKPERYLAAAFSEKGRDPDAAMAMFQSEQNEVTKDIREIVKRSLRGRKSLRLRTMSKGGPDFWKVSKRDSSPRRKRGSIQDLFGGKAGPS